MRCQVQLDLASETHNKQDVHQLHGKLPTKENHADKTHRQMV